MKTSYPLGGLSGTLMMLPPVTLLLTAVFNFLQSEGEDRISLPNQMPLNVKRGCFSHCAGTVDVIGGHVIARCTAPLYIYICSLSFSPTQREPPESRVGSRAWKGSGECM